MRKWSLLTVIIYQNKDEPAAAESTDLKDSIERIDGVLKNSIERTDDVLRPPDSIQVGP